MRRVEFLCHDINVHVPHHVNSKIPWYNLRSATDSLRQNWGQVGAYVSSMDTPVTFRFSSAFAHAVGDYHISVPLRFCSRSGRLCKHLVMLPHR